MNKLPDYLIKIVFVAVAIILWVFMALTAWDGITHSEPKVIPTGHFGLKEGKIIESSGVILYQNNTLIASVPPVLTKPQVLGVLMERIAFCESSNRQYNSDGSVLRGRVNPRDVGLFQINEKYWLQRSIEKGLDIYTKEGNIAMAKYILERQGLSAWQASSNCWNK